MAAPLHISHRDMTSVARHTSPITLEAGGDDLGRRAESDLKLTLVPADHVALLHVDLLPEMEDQLVVFLSLEDQEITEEVA